MINNISYVRIKTQFVYKIFLLIFFFFEFISTSFSQTDTRNTQTKQFFSKIDYNKIQVKNYPEQAKTNNIEGTIRVMFSIDSLCRLSKIKLLDSLGYGCENSAIDNVKFLVDEYKRKMKNKCNPIDSIIVPIRFRMY